MRVLIVTGDFAGENRNPWLLDDLAIALADAGDDVDVLVYDTKRGRTAGLNQYSDKRIRVFGVGPTKARSGRAGKLLNYLAAGRGLHTAGFQMVRRRRYDLCIYTSIGIFSWGLPTRLRRAGVTRRTVFVLWDFFPIHQLEIGRITRKVLHAPLRAMEALSMKAADVIAVMSPANDRFLRAYHPNIKTPSIIVPPWASDAPPGTAEHVTKRDRFTVIFGGQLAAGRSLESLLRAARRLQDEMLPIDLLIVGEGPARTALTGLADKLGLANTTFARALPRPEYRRILQSTHVGVAVTVSGVAPPTFPSKVVEYCASSIPVIVCSEASSDTGALVENAGAGVAVLAGDIDKLTLAIRGLYQEYLIGTLESRGRCARRLFETQLSVEHAASTIRAVAVHR